jgi:hypothetical protein
MSIQLPSIAFNTSRRLSFVMRLSALSLESTLLQEADRDHLVRLLPIEDLSAGRAVSLATIVVLLRSHQGARQTFVTENVA